MRNPPFWAPNTATSRTSIISFSLWIHCLTALSKTQTNTARYFLLTSPNQSSSPATQPPSAPPPLPQSPAASADAASNVGVAAAEKCAVSKCRGRPKPGGVRVDEEVFACFQLSVRFFWEILKMFCSWWCFYHFSLVWSCLGLLPSVFFGFLLESGAQISGPWRLPEAWNLELNLMGSPQNPFWSLQKPSFQTPKTQQNQKKNCPTPQSKSSKTTRLFPTTSPFPAFEKSSASPKRSSQYAPKRASAGASATWPEFLTKTRYI